MSALRYRGKIDKYKRLLQSALNGKDPFGIDSVLEEINQQNEEWELHHHLRLEIIKGQLCLRAYYKWRSDMR